MKLGLSSKCGLDFVDPEQGAMFLVNFDTLDCNDLRSVATRLKLLRNAPVQPAPVTSSVSAPAISSVPEIITPVTSSVSAPAISSVSAPAISSVPGTEWRVPTVSSNHARYASSTIGVSPVTTAPPPANVSANPNTIFGINKTLFYGGIAAIVLLYFIRSKK